MSLAAIDRSQTKFGPHGKRSLNSYKSARERFPEAASTLVKAHELLGVKLATVIPTASLPSSKGHDLGVGNYAGYSHEILQFLGFNNAKRVADLPVSHISPSDLGTGKEICPYAGDSSMLATHLIDWEALPRQIQPASTLQFVKAGNASNGSSYATYENVGTRLPAVIDEFYRLNAQETRNSEVTSYFTDYSSFIGERGELIKANVLANKLAESYRDEEVAKDYSKWSEEHKAIFSDKLSIEAKITELGLGQEVEKNFLTQFIAFKQLQERNQKLQKAGIEVVGDVPIAIPAIYQLLHPKAFLNDYRLGAPPEKQYAKDGGKDIGQKWGFLVLDPRQFVNSDNSLGEAGQILQNHFKWLGSLFGGKLRIDHGINVLGGGWVYPKDSNPADSRAFRLRFAPTDHPNSLARELSLIKDPAAFNEVEFGYDPDSVKRDYLEQHPEIIDQASEWLSRIVLPALRGLAEGMHTEPRIVIENLGVLPLPVRIAYEKLARDNPGVSQMFVFQHTNIEDSKNEHRPTSTQQRTGDTFFASTHDSENAFAFVQKIFQEKEQAPWIQYFKSLFPHFDETKVSADPKEFLKYFMAASLLRGTHMAGGTSWTGMFFTDLFGLTLNKEDQQGRYNDPGTSGAINPNWRTKMVDGWQKAYEDRLEDGSLTSTYAAAALGIEAKYKDEAYTPVIQQLVTNLEEIDAELKR